MTQINITKVVESLSALNKPKDKTFEILENKQVRRILIKKLKEGVSLTTIVQVLKNQQIHISVPTLRKWKRTHLSLKQDSKQ